MRDLGTVDLPKLPGIYALWHEDMLLYVGIARVDPKDTKNPQAAGVPGRLGTYRRCRLTSDFAIACAFRFVVPSLSDNQSAALATGIFGVRDVQNRRPRLGERTRDVLSCDRRWRDGGRGRARRPLLGPSR